MQKQAQLERATGCPEHNRDATREGLVPDTGQPLQAGSQGSDSRGWRRRPQCHCITPAPHGGAHQRSADSAPLQDQTTRLALTACCSVSTTCAKMYLQNPSEIGNEGTVQFAAAGKTQMKEAGRPQPPTAGSAARPRH